MSASGAGSVGRARAQDDPGAAARAPVHATAHRSGTVGESRANESALDVAHVESRCMCQAGHAAESVRAGGGAALPMARPLPLWPA